METAIIVKSDTSNIKTEVDLYFSEMGREDGRRLRFVFCDAGSHDVETSCYIVLSELKLVSFTLKFVEWI
jgi:hypothetical protein